MFRLLLPAFLVSHVAASTIPACYLYGLPSLPGPIVMTRASANAMCAAAKPSELNCTTPVMFINFNGENASSNAIHGTSQTFDAACSVQGPTGLVVTPSWPGLFSSSPLTNSFIGAGVVTTATPVSWWSGMTASGELGNNCDNWQDGDAGAAGYTTATTGGAALVVHNAASFCVNQKLLICACVTAVTPPPTSCPTSCTPTCPG